MTFAYDDYLQIPTQDIYDTHMMELAINAARDMYDRGLKQIKDFYTQYGDFMSPFSKDMERYGQMIGGVRDMINDAYAKGIDLTKSPEGRALLSRAVYSVNPQEFNNMRANAKLGYAYLDAMQKLQEKGLYSKEMEDYALRSAGIPSFDDFSSANGATWTRTSPIQYQDMNSIIEPIVKNLDYSFDPELTARMNDGYDYQTVSEDRIRLTINDNMRDLTQSGTAAGYYWDLAKQAANGDEDSARSILQNWYTNRASDLKKIKREANPFALDDYRTNNNIQAARERAATDYYYDVLAKADTNLDGKISDAEKKAYAAAMSSGGKNKKDPNDDIFTRAEYTQGPSRYDPDNEKEYSQIRTENPNIRHQKTESGQYVYIIPSQERSKAGIYNEDGTEVEIQGEGDIYFVPSGGIKYESGVAKYSKQRPGKLGEIPNDYYSDEPHYYIYGKILNKDGKVATDVEGNPVSVKMRVNRRNIQ